MGARKTPLPANNAIEPAKLSKREKETLSKEEQRSLYKPVCRHSPKVNA
jgi:hypothetical protein